MILDVTEVHVCNAVQQLAELFVTPRDGIGIRGTDLSKLGDEQRRQYAALQARYRSKEKMSEADLARIAEFEEQFKG